MRLTFIKLILLFLISTTTLSCYPVSSSAGSSAPPPTTPFTPEKRTAMVRPVFQPQLGLPTPALEATLPSLPPIHHIVQTGENLTLIAQMYALSVEQLLANNPLANPNLLYAGQTLLIPPPTVPVPPQNATPTVKTEPSSVNGIPFEQILVMDEQTVAHIQRIAAEGQELDRNFSAFSKLGDSTIESPHFLSRFDAGTYQLGDYEFLQPTIDHFAGSFARDSLAVQIGLHS